MAKCIRVFKGICASGKYDEENFLMRMVDSAIMLEETYDSSKIGGGIYASLKKSGNLINDADILIASIMGHGAILITNNENHFKRIAGLKIENWLRT